MAPDAHYWLRRLGFHVWHVPGVSRAWRLEFIRGGYVLLTDAGGFDLPEPAGPYCAIWMSSGDEALGSPTLLGDIRELFLWIERQLPHWGTGAAQGARIAETLRTFVRWEVRRRLMESCLLGR